MLFTIDVQWTQIKRKEEKKSDGRNQQLYNNFTQLKKEETAVGKTTT